MKQPVIIAGGGGHAKVVYDILSSLSYSVLGYVAPMQSSLYAAIEYLGNDDAVFTYHPENILIANGVGSTGNQDLRTKVFNKFRQRGYRFVSLVHPSATVARSLQLGEGCQVMAGAVLQPGVCCEDNVLINTRAGIDHDCFIGAHTHVAVGATLCGQVTLGKQVFVGAGSTIIQGVKVGIKSVVGAGSLVLRSISHDEIVVGVPAQRIIK
ncbi:MAG: acetyltransferase [Candidatus Electrothrix sp. AW2]|nr:acetyltransferase [Candidatus Electrothrix gigas]